MIRGLVAIAVLATATACGGPDPVPADRASGPPAVARTSPAPPPIPAAVRSLIDEGNTHYEEGDHPAALASYRSAVEADSTVASAWFGLYMTYVELGETERAEEIKARITRMASPTAGDPHAASPQGGPGHGG